MSFLFSSTSLITNLTPANGSCVSLSIFVNLKYGVFFIVTITLLPSTVMLSNVFRLSLFVASPEYVSSDFFVIFKSISSSESMYPDGDFVSFNVNSPFELFPSTNGTKSVKSISPSSFEVPVCFSPLSLFINSKLAPCKTLLSLFSATFLTSNVNVGAFSFSIVNAKHGMLPSKTTLCDFEFPSVISSTYFPFCFVILNLMSLFKKYPFASTSDNVYSSFKIRFLNSNIPFSSVDCISLFLSFPSSLKYTSFKAFPSVSTFFICNLGRTSSSILIAPTYSLSVNPKDAAPLTCPLITFIVAFPLLSTFTINLTLFVFNS